ncbi:hypothetical protein SAMD00024442_109_3 [Candidatus Symbiothrix dinenymphae]|nr:hypothetical protein SAMD00024442_109_3 [Candidatus Symbiothrix dinenymphae]
MITFAASFYIKIMLEKILSVSGKSGLYKLISQGKNLFIVESLLDKQRIPVYLRDKVVALRDIAVYTADDDVKLGEVLTKMYEKEAGKLIDYKPAEIQPDELRAYLATLLPNFDRERVYVSDIKKMLAWYNILITAGITDFSNAKEEEDTTESTEASDSAEKTEKKPMATVTKPVAKTIAPKSAPKATTKSAAKPAVRGLKGASAKKG